MCWIEVPTLLFISEYRFYVKSWCPILYYYWRAILVKIWFCYVYVVEGYACMLLCISTIPIMLWWSWYYTNPKDEAGFYHCSSKVSFCHTAILSSSHPAILPFWHLFFYLVILSFHSKCTLPIFSCKTYTTNRAVELHFPDLQTGYSLLQPFPIGIQFQVQCIYIQENKKTLKM